MPDTPFQPVGHLIAASDGSIEGAQGIGYDYIMAAGGLYVQSQSDDIVARINIARRNIRGLGAIDEKIQLTDGPIPGHMIALGLRWFRTNPDTERFFAIRRGTEGYELVIPEQEGQALSLTYTPEPRAIAEFHSHSRARALFSKTDNADEQGFKIYGVLGRAHQSVPELNLRLGIYGNFAPLIWSDAFSGPTPNVTMIDQTEQDDRNRRSGKDSVRT